MIYKVVGCIPEILTLLLTPIIKYIHIVYTVADDRAYDQIYADNSGCSGHATSLDRKYQDLYAGIEQSDYCQQVRGTVSPVT